jgi:ribosomal protein S18 acetylase RimI-like enzyme
VQLSIRLYRQEELPIILQRGVQTAQVQLSARELPSGDPQAVAAQLYRMYQSALQTSGAAIAVVDRPMEMGREGPAAHALLMPQSNPFTGERELVVLDIWTDPALRGRQLGKALLQWAEGYGRSIGCGSLVAQVALQNAPSLRLFERSGFAQERVVVGRRL